MSIACRFHMYLTHTHHHPTHLQSQLLCKNYEGPSTILTKSDLTRFVHKLIRQRKDFTFLREGKPQAELDKQAQEYIDVVVGRIYFEASCGGSQRLNVKTWIHNSRR